MKFLRLDTGRPTFAGRVPRARQRHCRTGGRRATCRYGVAPAFGALLSVLSRPPFSPFPFALSLSKGEGQGKRGSPSPFSPFRSYFDRLSTNGKDWLLQRPVTQETRIPRGAEPKRLKIIRFEMRALALNPRPVGARHVVPLPGGVQECAATHRARWHRSCGTRAPWAPRRAPAPDRPLAQSPAPPWPPCLPDAPPPAGRAPAR